MEFDIYNPKCQVFQVDSDIVKSAYNELDNYLIISDEKSEKKKTPMCVLYFSGHSIYFPNEGSTFENEIIKKNRFEWYGMRIKEAEKHIFLRDIHKQWYLSGINAKINSPEKLLFFLEKETDGYDIVCVGSSAGGYAAILYGSLLGAKCVYAFSPRLEMHSLDKYSEESVNPIYFRLRNTERKKYMELHTYIKGSKVPMYCFYPINSFLDKLQLEYINQYQIDNNPNFHMIKFNTWKHGVPFPKVALMPILQITPALSEFENKINNPILFSIQVVGIIKTVSGIWKQLKKRYFPNFCKS